MNNQTLHWWATGLTAIAGFVQWLTPFIPPTYTPVALGAVAGANALLHTFFPAGEPTAPTH
jgi:hypothetical protein